MLVVLLSAPMLGLGWLLLRRSTLSAFEIFCLAVFMAGLAGYAAIGGPVSTAGDSVAAEFYFRYIGYFAIVPIAAGGWAELWSNTPKDARAARVTCLRSTITPAGGSARPPHTCITRRLPNGGYIWKTGSTPRAAYRANSHSRGGSHSTTVRPCTGIPSRSQSSSGKASAMFSSTRLMAGAHLSRTTSVALSSAIAPSTSIA